MRAASHATGGGTGVGTRGGGSGRGRGAGWEAGGEAGGEAGVDREDVEVVEGATTARGRSLLAGRGRAAGGLDRRRRRASSSSSAVPAAPVSMKEESSASGAARPPTPPTPPAPRAMRPCEIPVRIRRSMAMVLPLPSRARRLAAEAEEAADAAEMRREGAPVSSGVGSVLSSIRVEPVKRKHTAIVVTASRPWSPLAMGERRLLHEAVARPSERLLCYLGLMKSRKLVRREHRHHTPPGVSVSQRTSGGRQGVEPRGR